jgi:uncharacterized protein (TIGR03437 family)
MFRSHTLWAIVPVLSLLQFSGNAQNYTINTIAGLPSNFQTGGLANRARFGVVSAVAAGPDGSVYVADAAYNQVFRVRPGGRMTLFAGSGIRGYGGDFGPATAAMLDTPTALAVDSGGDVFIGDSGNHRVREVSVYGNIQTVAGDGQIAPSPALSHILPGEAGPATSAPLNQIAGLTFASNDDLVIADIGNNRIFRVSNDGNIHTIAGNATTPSSLSDQSAQSATLSGPTGVAADLYGSIYFAEQQTGLINKIDANGRMTRIVGTGSRTDAPVANASPLSYPLISPTALGTDGWHLYIADAGRVSMYTLPIGRPAHIQMVAGRVTPDSAWTGDGGPALGAGMNPMSVTVSKSDGVVYLADSLLTLDFRNRVRKISGNVVNTFAGGSLPAEQGDGGPATSAQLYLPQALAIDPAGNILVADTFNSRVRIVTTNGKIQTVVGAGIGQTAGDTAPSSAVTLSSPQGLALDRSGNLYIFDGMHLQQLNAGGILNTIAVLGTQSPSLTAGLDSLMPGGSLAVDANNNIYVAALASVRKISPSTGAMSMVAGTGTAGYSGENGLAKSSQIGNLAGIAVDAAGNLYIADADNNCVRKVDGAGSITTLAGGGTSLADGSKATDAALDIPIAVATDSAGNVYIAEYGGNRIRVVTTDGTIRTIAGNGLEGFSGDGGFATNASLNGPTDVKVDPQGNVYIADSLNSVIRKLTAASAPPTPAISAVTNSASLTGGPVALGERVRLTGTALGANSEVFFNNVPAPVLESTFSSAQVVVPYELSGQSTAQLTVTTEGVTSAPFTVQISPSAPGVFTRSGSGQGRAFAFTESGMPNSPQNTSPAGSMLAILCTGEGLITPSVATGTPISMNPPSPVLSVSASIGGLPAVVDQAYSIPGTIGQFVVDLRVPDGVQTDDNAPVTIMVGDTTTQPGVTVSVKQADDSSSDVVYQPSLKWYQARTHGKIGPKAH